MTLRGRTLFITGASRGIGLAIALRAARDGANIVVAAKTDKPHPKLSGTIFTAAEEISKAGGSALLAEEQLAPLLDDLNTPQAMAALKKLATDLDTAVRKAAPRSELIVDANEAWTAENLEQNLGACADAGVTLVEQPLPAGHDAALSQIGRPIAVCADESVHDRASLDSLRARYDAVNIKLDKTGGLTEALAMADAARAQGFEIMVGCMVATSLAMAPAMLLTPLARYVDLDGPLLLARDRDGGLRYDGSMIYPPDAALWG